MATQDNCKTLKTPCGEFSYAELIKMVGFVFLLGMLFMQFKINNTDLKETKLTVAEHSKLISSIGTKVDMIYDIVSQ